MQKKPGQLIHQSKQETKKICANCQAWSTRVVSNRLGPLSGVDHTEVILPLIIATEHKEIKTFTQTLINETDVRFKWGDFR